MTILHTDFWKTHRMWEQWANISFSVSRRWDYVISVNDEVHLQFSPMESNMSMKKTQKALAAIFDNKDIILPASLAWQTYMPITPKDGLEMYRLDEATLREKERGVLQENMHYDTGIFVRGYFGGDDFREEARESVLLVNPWQWDLFNTAGTEHLKIAGITQRQVRQLLNFITAVETDVREGHKNREAA